MTTFNVTPSYDGSSAEYSADAPPPAYTNGVAAQKAQDVQPQKQQETVVESGNSAGLQPNEVQDISWAFVQQYYTHVNKSPEKLHLFYNKNSTAIHGIETGGGTPSVGQPEIFKLLSKHDFKNCKVMVSNIDCQKTLADGVLVQVIGEMANEGEPSQKFVQTILLAPQNHGYYVLNDILRFLKEDAPEDDQSDYTVDTPESQSNESEQAEKEEAVASSSVKVEPVASTEPVASSAISEANSESHVFSRHSERIKRAQPAESVASDSSVTAGSSDAPLSETSGEKEYEKANAFLDGQSSAKANGSTSESTEKVTGSVQQAEKVSTPAAVVAPVTSAAPSAPATSSAPSAHVAPSAPAPAASVTPALPTTPMSWAARAAVKPAASTTTPVTAAAPAAPVSAPSPAPSAASSVSATPVAAVAAVVEKQLKTPSTPTTASAVNAAASGHRRGPKEYFSAYIKHVTGSVNEAQLKQALQLIGNVTHFEVSRPKNCAFVDFVDLPTLKAALAVHELKVGNNTVLVEERKRGGAKKNSGNGNGSSSNGGSNGYYGGRRANNNNKKGPRPQQ